MEAAQGVGDVGGDAEVRPNCAAPRTLFMVSTSSGSFAVSAGLHFQLPPTMGLRGMIG